MANATFRQSNHRQGSWTKRNSGKYVQNTAVTGSISNVAAAPQATSSHQSVRSFHFLER